MPTDPDKHVWLIGARYKKALQAGIDALGLEVIWLPDNPDLSEPVRGHADLSALAIPGGGVLLAPFLRNTSIPEQLKSINCHFEFADIMQGPKYPEDVQLCICHFGNKVIYNPKTVANYLIESRYQEYSKITCKQGYTRCSVFTVNESTVITSDDGIFEILTKININVLKIRPGNIRLDGYDYGFIGGSGFMLNKTNAVFSGILYQLPDKENILNFLYERNVSVYFLTNEPLFDFGGAVRIKAYE